MTAGQMQWGGEMAAGLLKRYFPFKSVAEAVQAFEQRDPHEEN